MLSKKVKEYFLFRKQLQDSSNYIMNLITNKSKRLTAKEVEESIEKQIKDW